MLLIFKMFKIQEYNHSVIKQKFGGGVGGVVNWEIGIDAYTLLLYIKQITNKNLLYSIGNFTQYTDLYGNRI